MNPAAIGRGHAFLAFLIYLAFVVYGSLVPFEYRDRTLDDALQQFAGIPYLDLGVGSRADWVANIVLYVPLAFLGCTWVAGMRRVGVLRLLGVLFVVVLCLAVAVSVEFVQIFFAPRTVSINDLLAETLGIFGGIAVWAVWRERIARLFDAFSKGGRQSVVAVFAAYGIAYIALSLFPFDFVVSLNELAWKTESGNQGWLVAGGCGGLLRCGARLTGDALAIAPLGLLMALLQPDASHKRVFVAGVIIGLVLEGMQFLLASGTSQGLSVVLRGAGLTAGVALGQQLALRGPLSLARFVWRVAPVAALPYAALLAGVNGWFSRAWLPVGEAFARFADIRLMPFYYHYFSTEPAAMASLLANAAMYAPVGVVVWAWRATRGRAERFVALFAALAALQLAFFIELGKFFVPPKHPDFTDLLIAAAAAAFTYALASWAERALVGSVPGEPLRPAEPVPPIKPEVSRALPPAIDWPSPRPVGLLLIAPPLLATLFGLTNFPVGAIVLGAALLVYGISLWRWPLIWCFAVPALVPVLDLSSLTGRLLLDAYDLVVLVTLGVTYARYYGMKPRRWPNTTLPVAVALLWVTWGVATLRGLWPLWSIEGGIFASSHSPLEAWVVGKGLLWALLMVPVLRRVPRAARAIAMGYVLNGLVAALVTVTLIVLWERHVFVGLLDFENVFRVTGTFSSMNTGGAYIEAFIAMAFPALAAWVLIQRSWALKSFGVSVAGLSSYAMLVTFSRGGYAALITGLLIVGWGALRVRSETPMRRLLVLVGLAAVVIAAAVPVLSGGFAQSRMARVLDDLSIRQAHWERALGLMDDGVSTALVGMGFGQYPTQYLMLAEVDKPTGTYQVALESDNPYLRLGAGETVFLDQMVNVEPDTRYGLSARVRGQHGPPALSIPLCEKALLYSFNCVWTSLEPRGPRGEWATLSVEIRSGELGRGGNWPHPPVKLSLHNPGAVPVDVDDVSLETQDGRELLRNGDFSHGVDHWIFVTDQDLAWHIHQQWVETYFGQGLLGVVAALALIAGAALVLVPAMMRGDLRATAFTAALAAFLTVGLLGSTVDSPRSALLFYLVALCSAILASKTEQTR